ncbi:hypothetical protein GLYMA_07G104300v4 [Glycine max]|uniref:Uncharacterized protein n=1 Tax=Glycine max TaxID=3847 RepID=A0A0R0J1T6_SOYBN|nr:hypothetical protein GYH30_017982 [Glycine max]KRH48672.1 hypothetical protein GLYMA_07G104300v4 [Glycine max]
MNKDERFAQKGVPIHSQVMKIRQESEKIVDWSPGKPEIRPVLREISRQISRSPLGISGRPISVGGRGRICVLPLLLFCFPLFLNFEWFSHILRKRFKRRRKVRFN